MERGATSLLSCMLAIFVLAGATARAGALEDDLSRCLGQPSWFTRVQCYDRTLKAHGIAPAPVGSQPTPSAQDAGGQGLETTALSPAPATGNWRAESAPAVEPGVDNVWLMLTSDNAALNRAGEQVTAELVLRCMERSLDVMVWAGGTHLQSPQPMISRLGSDPPEALDWGTSSDGEWAFHPAPGAFIDAMAAENRLALSLESADAPGADYEFTITGLKAIVDRLARDCPRT